MKFLKKSTYQQMQEAIRHAEEIHEGMAREIIILKNELKEKSYENKTAKELFNLAEMADRNERKARIKRTAIGTVIDEK